MVEIRRTEVFRAWVNDLADARAKARIFARIDRMRLGNPGDVQPVGEGVSEMRVDHGPGYRIYFVQRGDVVVILLCGGTKGCQAKDIEAAKALASGLEE